MLKSGDCGAGRCEDERLRAGRDKSFATQGVRLRPSLYRLATVDNDGAPNDEASRIRTQPHNRRSDLLWPSHSPNRFLRDYRLPPLGGRTTEAFHHRRVDNPGHTALIRMFDCA